MVSAVATSFRPAAAQPAIPAPSSENTPSPRRVLAPIRAAPAAPAKAPLGMEWAAKADREGR